jgi:hypothetical protein
MYKIKLGGIWIVGIKLIKEQNQRKDIECADASLRNLCFLGVTKTIFAAVDVSK